MGRMPGKLMNYLMGNPHGKLPNKRENNIRQDAW